MLIAEKSLNTARDLLTAEINKDERRTQQEHEAHDGSERQGRWGSNSGRGKLDEPKDRWGIEAENARIGEAAHPGPRMDYRASPSPTTVRLTEAPATRVRLITAPWLRRKPEERRARPADHPPQGHEERRGGDSRPPSRKRTG